MAASKIVSWGARSIALSFSFVVVNPVVAPPAVFPFILVGLIPAKPPLGVDFITRPFAEPMLLKIAAAYEHATRLRQPTSGRFSASRELGAHHRPSRFFASTTHEDKIRKY